MSVAAKAALTYFILRLGADSFLVTQRIINCFMLNLARQWIISMELTMRNTSDFAVEDYNEKLFPVMAHKLPTQRSSIIQYM